MSQDFYLHPSFCPVCIRPRTSHVDGDECKEKLAPAGKKGAHRDHIEPLRPRDPSKPPGQHLISNIQLLCHACNSKKQNIDPYRFTQDYEGRLFPDLPRKAKK